MRRALVVCTLAVAAAVPVGGHDKWEFGQAGGDDDADTVNSLAPGRGQAHDLEQDGVTPDEDWFRVAVRARQSYEVRASGSTVAFAIQAGPICQAQFCAVMTRVDDGGAALQQAVASEGEPRIPVLRWTASASGAEYVRVRGGGPPATWGPNDEYTIEMSNTTVFLPRFNNTATQTTVLIVQNTTSAALSGAIDFWNAAGALLHSEPLSLPARGVVTVNAAGIAALVGQSGSASIAHSGTYGAIVGKAAALEPATGFTFDTAFTTAQR
jgi:hypothetical protein